MLDEDNEGDGYVISVRTRFGRVIVHVTQSACNLLGEVEATG